MKLAVGPLTTGTYMGHAVANEGKFYTIHKAEEDKKLGLSEEKEHPGSKWHFEKVGENRFKARNRTHDVTVSIHPDKTTLEPTEEESLEWIVEPTDVVGEYTAYPIHDQPIFLTATEEGLPKLGPKSEMARFKVYRVDDD